MAIKRLDLPTFIAVCATCRETKPIIVFADATAEVDTALDDGSKHPTFTDGQCIECYAEWAKDCKLRCRAHDIYLRLVTKVTDPTKRQALREKLLKAPESVLAEWERKLSQVTT